MFSRGWNGAGYSHPDVAQIDDGPSLRVGLRRLGACRPSGWVEPLGALRNPGCRGLGARRWPDRGRGLPMMEVLTPPIWKTSTCLTLPSPTLT